MIVVQPERREMGMYFAGRCWFLVFAGYFGGRYFFDSVPVFAAFMCVVVYFIFRLFATKPRDVFEVKIESDQITLGRRKWSMLLIPSGREEMTERIDFTSLFFFTKASNRTSALNILTLRKSNEDEIKIELDHVPSLEKANQEIQQAMNSALLEKGKQILTNLEQVIDCGPIGLSKDYFYVDSIAYDWGNVELAFEEKAYTKTLLEIEFIGLAQEIKRIPIDELANTDLTVNLLKWKLRENKEA